MISWINAYKFSRHKCATTSTRCSLTQISQEGESNRSSSHDYSPKFTKACYKYDSLRMPWHVLTLSYYTVATLTILHYCKWSIILVQYGLYCTIILIQYLLYCTRRIHPARRIHLYKLQTYKMLISISTHPWAHPDHLIAPRHSKGYIMVQYHALLGTTNDKYTTLDQ